MSSSRPASASSAVMRRSSPDGVGSPLGWSCTTSTAAPYRVAIDFADANRRPGQIPDIYRGQRGDHVLGVEHRHAQLLALEATHGGEQPLRDVARRANDPATVREGGGTPPSDLAG